MSLLNYAYHAAPTSHKDVLGKFRAFALAQGWAIDDYQTSVDWLGPTTYSWKAGNSDFLQISSNGYGTQDIIARFHFEGTGVDPLAETCYFGGIEPGAGTPSSGSSTIPVQQDDYNLSGSYSRIALPSGSHTACWFFGNDKVLFAVDQINSVLCIFWWCGSLEMFDQTQDCFFAGSSSNSNSLIKYYNYESSPNSFHPPWMEYFGNAFWWDGAGKSSSGIKYSSSITYTDTPVSANNKGFTTLANVLNANAFSGRRVLIKPTVFGKIASTGLWHPAGTIPLYHMVFADLSIGEQIDYGGETYICFPNCIITRKYGTAFRIA